MVTLSATHPGHHMRYVSTAIIVVLAASCTSDIDRLQLVEDFERLKNAHDRENTLALFAADAELDFGPMGTMQGHEAIDRIHGYDAALSTTLEFDGCSIEDSDVVCRVTESNDWLKIAGIDSIGYDEVRFTINDAGKIARVSAIPSGESIAAIGTALTAFGGWAQQHEPERFGALLDAQGNFDYSFENGQKVLQLLREWQGAAD